MKIPFFLMCAFLLASNSAHAQVESNSQEIEITRLTKEKQLLTLRKEVESLRKEVSVAEDPLLQEAARRQATNTVLSALATSEVQADVAKIEAIKTLAGSTKAGKAGSVTVGTDSVTVIPIGGLADDSAFEEVAGNLCKKLRSINSNKIALIAPAGYPTDAALFKANFENLQSAAATARLMVPEGRSLLADLAIQSKIETKARKNPDSATSSKNPEQPTNNNARSNKGLPAVIAAISLIPTIANGVSDVTKIFRADSQIALRDTSNGTDFLIAKLVVNPSCGNRFGVSGDEPQLADEASRIIRVRNEIEVLIAQLNILANALQVAFTSEELQQNATDKFKSDISEYLFRTGNLLTSLRQGSVETDLESTKQKTGLIVAATKLLMSTKRQDNDLWLLIEAQRHTNSVKTSSVFSSDKLGKIVFVTATYKVFDEAEIKAFGWISSSKEEIFDTNFR